jgi:hypothetical protein
MKSNLKTYYDPVPDTPRILPPRTLQPRSAAQFDVNRRKYQLYGDHEMQGPWKNEDEVKAFFYPLPALTNWFTVIKELDDHPLWRNPWQDVKRGRADALLVPKPKLITAGWRSGPVLVDVKAPGTKTGEALGQVHDYMTSAFVSPTTGTSCIPWFGFVFLARKQHCVAASLMSHLHLGTINVGWSASKQMPDPPFEQYDLEFFCGESAVLRLSPDSARVGNTAFGMKYGSGRATAEDATVP